MRSRGRSTKFSPGPLFGGPDKRNWNGFSLRRKVSVENLRIPLADLITIILLNAGSISLRRLVVRMSIPWKYLLRISQDARVGPPDIRSCRLSVLTPIFAEKCCKVRSFLMMRPPVCTRTHQPRRLKSRNPIWCWCWRPCRVEHL